MTIEKQEIPRADDTSDRVGEAWIKMVKSGQESTYRSMRAEDVEELKGKMEKGEPIEKSLKYIVEYLKALDDSFSH